MSSRTYLVTSLAFGSACALLPIACATSDEPPLSAPPTTADGSPSPTGIADASDATSIDGTSIDAGLRAPCSESGFCPVPLPIVTPLGAVSAASMDDVWMTTQNGSNILHWDGKLVSVVYEYVGLEPARVEFQAIWAETKDDVWVLGRDENWKLFVVRFSPPAQGATPTFREHRIDRIWGLSTVWGTPTSDALWTTGSLNVNGESLVFRLREDDAGTLIVDDFRPPAPEGEPAPRWSTVWGFGPNDVYVGGGRTLAHYDGTSWTSWKLDTGIIASLRGTAPGQARQLWYHVEATVPLGPISTYLVPIVDGGAIGAPVFAATTPRAGCNGRIGAALSPTAGWFSNNQLVCRWTGTNLEPVPTALETGPVVANISGIWAGSADDVWVVGSALSPSENFPQMGLALRRTRPVDGGAP